MFNREVILLKGSGTVFISFAVYMSGLITEVTLVLLFMMILDFLTGLLRAWLTKTLNSTLGLSGVIKKVSILVLLAMTAAIEFLFVHIGQDTNGLIILGVSSFFIVNEGISILENCAQIGVPIPPILYNALDKLNRDPSGKEAALARDPQLEQLDKKALLDENKKLMQAIRGVESPLSADDEQQPVETTETEKEGAFK